MQRLSVLFSTPKGCYDYLSADLLPAGQIVAAPFGRRQEVGVIWPDPPDLSVPAEKLKPISHTLDLPPLPADTIQFIDWVSKYTLSPVGMVLKMALIPDLEKQSEKPLTFDPPQISFGTVSFSPAQSDAVERLSAKVGQGFSVSLLDGITGSGKTEVYFEAIAHALKQDKQVLVLLPEITLTSAWLARFQKRFGVLPAVWHSALTPKKRRDTWRSVLSGEIKVLVGARSALFLPFPNLGLIIVDEEHDSSYKQEDGVLYQARDMAVVRGKITNIPIILASATPSLETYANAQIGKYDRIVLPERFSGLSFPDVQIVDMRTKAKGKRSFISPLLEQKLRDNLSAGNQSLLFINRRGYAPLVLCRSCGERLKCPHCSAWLVEHRNQGFLQCHHCGYTRKIPQKCPTCQETDSFISCGAGVERIHEEVLALFPTARTALITSETMANPKVFSDLSDQVLAGNIDILIGTQILAKGHNFPNLTLVGVIDADMGLAGGDLRAGERTFQLLHQVMGRAGRDQKKGEALLQSYSPDNLIIKALAQNDRSRFLAEETAARQALQMPPFGRLAALIISGKNPDTTYQAATRLAQTAPFITGVSVLGPVSAPLALLRGKHRFRLLVKAPKNFNLQSCLTRWLDVNRIPASVDVRVDIDPYSFF
ncbi:MAG: primosomal protein N' [Alphaproteobacteria bacterium]|nr:primosomal protein N' [Alphaproteobacteria bacterium]